MIRTLLRLTMDETVIEQRDTKTVDIDEIEENGQSSTVHRIEQSGQAQQVILANVPSGQTAYRVLQIPGSDSQDLSNATIQLINSQIVGGTQAIQQVTTSNQNGGSSPQQTQFAVRTTEVQSNDSDLSSGQYYVMLPQASDRLTQIVPRNGQIIYNQDIVPLNQNRAVNRLQTKDLARRQQHNEVERRRRDKINTWINKISKVVPDCSDDHTKQGQSKGGILAKAYEYILELQQKGGSAQGHYDKEEVELLIQERNSFKSEVDKLRLEIEQYRRAIEENGMTISREPEIRSGDTN